MSPSNKLIRKDEGDKAHDLTSLPNNVIIWTDKNNPTVKAGQAYPPTF